MLIEKLKVLLASTQVLAIKSQQFHWCVEGRNFLEFHVFFDSTYSEITDTVDKIAEYIRILGSYTPGNITRYAELSVIQDQVRIPRAELMFVELGNDCEKMINLVIDLCEEATAERQHGIANYMAELQDLYAKRKWFINSIITKTRE